MPACEIGERKGVGGKGSKWFGPRALIAFPVDYCVSRVMRLLIWTHFVVVYVSRPLTDFVPVMVKQNPQGDE